MEQRLSNGIRTLQSNKRFRGDKNFLLERRLSGGAGPFQMNIADCEAAVAEVFCEWRLLNGPFFPLNNFLKQERRSTI